MSEGTLPAGRRVAVVGGGLGGLCAAGLLAREGCAVTLFEGSDRLGGKARAFTFGGVTLDGGPTLLTLPEVVRETFEALGAEDLLPPFLELPHQCQYVYPDGSRFDAYRELELTAASAGVMDPAEGKGVRRFYADAQAIYRAAGEPYLEAPYEGMASFMARVARRGLSAVAMGMRLGTLDALARRHFRTPALQQFVGRFATYAGASPYEASAAFALIPHLERAHGVHHVVGGMGALVEALRRAVLRLGVQVRLNARARWTPRGEGFEVGTEELAEVFDAVVVNADPLAVSGRRPQALALSGYVLFLEASARLSLPHHCVLFSGDYAGEFAELFSARAPSDPTVYVCHPAATDATMAPPGKSGLFVMANAPAVPPGASSRERATLEAELAALPERMLSRLFLAFPLLKGQVHVVGARTPADLERLGAPGGSIYGFLPHGRFGPFRRPRMRGRTPGVFFAGGGTHPGGGVPLVMLSGRFAAQLALRHLRAA